MRILYIHQYFSTPNGIKVTRAFELSRLWAQSGYDVTVLTTTSHMTGQDLAGAKGIFIKRLELNGCRILAFAIPYSQRMGKISRYCAWTCFLLVSILYALCSSRYDLIFARSTPLTTGIPAILGRRLRKIPYIFEVTDQWPEIPLEMGVIKNRMLKKSLLWLEKTIYKYSDAIITCSPGMTAGVDKVMKQHSIETRRIYTVPNFCETDIYGPHVDGSQYRTDNGWDKKVIFLHAGTMGRANSLGFVIDVAEKLRHNDEIRFVLMGEGNQKPFLQQRITDLGLTNVEVRPAVVRSQLPEVLASADVAIVIFCNTPIIQDNSANKFFDALSAGKPVLLNYSGWQRSVLEEAGAGFGVSQYCVEEFVERVEYLYANRNRLGEFGRKARMLAEERFSKKILAAHSLEVIEAVIGTR